jgi:hypothetical protein
VREHSVDFVVIVQADVCEHGDDVTIAAGAVSILNRRVISQRSELRSCKVTHVVSSAFCLKLV